MVQTITRSARAGVPAAPPGLSRESVVDLSRHKHEPAWLREWRLEGWDVFERLPMPTQRDEAWKRTKLSGLDLRPLVPFHASSDGSLEADQLPRELREAARVTPQVDGRLVQRDSTLVFRALSDQLIRQGVLFTDLDSAVREYPDLVRDRLGALVPAETGKFQALNAALWSGGTFLLVPRGKALPLPLQTVLSIGTSDMGLFPRTLLVAEETAEVTLVEEYTSGARLGQPLVSAVTELLVGAGAKVRYVTVQQWGAPVWHFATLRSAQQRDASVTFLTAATGGRLTKQFVEAHLNGDGSEADLIGLMFGDASQHFDSHTLQEHVGSQTRSDLLFKVALRDRATSSFTGLVRVNASALKTDANQENRNLLLSDQAKADSDPKLEILNSDIVRCSHGATVGPVEQEALFYLQTRGLDRAAAEHLLVEGFFDPVIARVPIDTLRAKLWATVRRKLGS